MKKYFSFVLLLMLVLTLQNSSKGKKILLAFKGQPNDTFAYSIISESFSSQNEMGNYSETSTDFLVNYEFQVQSVNDSNVYTIKGIIKKIIFSVNTGKEEITFNSEKGAENDEASLKIFKRLLNAEFIFQLDKKGDYVVAGLDTKISRIFSIVRLPGNVSKKQLMQFVFGTFGNAATSGRLHDIFFYPDKPIGAKDKWKEESKEEGMTYTMSYKVAKFKKNKMKIVADGKSSMSKDLSQKGDKTTYIISFDGTMEMEYNIDTDTGLMETSKAHNKQEGTVNINSGNSNTIIPSTNEETTTVTKI
ncbi:hypothetical protein J7L48_11060 [bacterium]|nr:hypothetical protein [bacterium]